MTSTRAPWTEAELRGHEDTPLLICPGWTNDTETLVLPLRETGWFETTAEAYRAFENVQLYWGWVGVDQDQKLVICSSEGAVDDSEEIVTDVMQVTLARIPTHPGH